MYNTCITPVKQLQNICKTGLSKQKKRRKHNVSVSPKMENTDYLNMRTTNINIRISPLLKSALIEKAARKGVCLSDYILHLMTQYIKMEEQLKQLQSKSYSQENEVISLQNELEAFKELATPYLRSIEKGMTVGGKAYQPKSPFDILQILLSTLKIQEP